MNDVNEFLNFVCPRYENLPNVFLYKDQVIEYIEGVLKILVFDEEEKLLTPTMLNNYVKQHIVSHPKDKKYNKEHLAYLITVCVFKQVFTLKETCDIVKIQIGKYPIDVAYDYFCIELEKAIKSVFATRDFSAKSSATKVTYESEVLRSSVLAVAHKLFAKRYILKKS